ncbi:MAG TPA: hypothetical protein PLA84_11020, partial [Petrotogaceae bacterium]|nr:hypothetical protein [Petrotogaceae bacterium]
ADIVKRVYEKPVDDIDKDDLDIVYMVYSGKFDDYPEFAIGEAFDDFFVSPRWDVFTASDSTIVVQFNGTAFEEDEGYDIMLQFTVEPDKESWYVSYFEVDGNQQELSLLPDLLKYIFTVFSYN